MLSSFDEGGSGGLTSAHGRELLMKESDPSSWIKTRLRLSELPGPHFIVFSCIQQSELIPQGLALDNSGISEELTGISWGSWIFGRKYPY
jgi:hypothetical protein